MSAPTCTESTRLRDLDAIVAAGAAAVADWELTDEQADKLAALVADAVPSSHKATDSPGRPT